jgi:hypothetical protein
MTSKKLGALLRSVPPATVATVQGSPSEPLTPLVLEATANRRDVRTTLIDPEVPLQVLIPAGIRKQLALKAAEEGQSLRALVLQGIRSLGITVTDADIRGKRGRHRV